MAIQDFRKSTRFVMFETDVAGWEYATHGGTAFIVDFDGLPYGVICKHCFGDFDWRQLAITDSRFGSAIAGLDSIYYPTTPVRYSVGSDVMDIAVIRFANDVQLPFFHGDAFVVRADTVTTSSFGDELAVSGALKEKSKIDDEVISPTFALLGLADGGSTSADPAIRTAIAEYHSLDFASLAGLSGSPVFNLTRRALCGVVVRGNIIEGRARLWYVDFSDVLEVLRAVHGGRTEVAYSKTVL